MASVVNRYLRLFLPAHYAACILAGCLLAPGLIRPAIGQVQLRQSYPAPELNFGQTSESGTSSRRSVKVSRDKSRFDFAPAPSFESLGKSTTEGVNPDANIDAGERQQQFEALQREADAMQRHLTLVRRIVDFVSPTIVHIEAIKNAETAKGFTSSKIEEAGAGVLVNIDGRPHVLTNRHVIHPAELSSIRIELNDGKLLRPVRVWTDPSTDVAVMAISDRDVTVANLGNSDSVGIGDFVLAIGSPFGLSHSVTYGIISAKGRRNLELGTKEIQIQDFFQTDAAINPGNSGGPLLNLRGEVVGINTAIASNSGGNEGIGFTIPINMAVQVARQLVSRGSLQRSYLGVKLDAIFDIRTAQRLGMNAPKGALIKDIVPNSPASKAGLKIGDVILELNGQSIENDGHLVESVGLSPAGSRATLLINRSGQMYRALATLEPVPAG